MGVGIRRSLWTGPIVLIKLMEVVPMLIPDDRKYASTHEWVLSADTDTDVVLVGITDFAQDQLGDVMFVGGFKTQVQLKQGEVAGVVESVKAASDIYAPISGMVIEFNEHLTHAPETLNDHPYDTWIFKLIPDNPADIAELLSAEHYQMKNN